MDSGSGASSVRIDLLNDHNYATWSIQVLLVLGQKRVRSIIDGLEVAPAAPATSASDDVKEKYRERLILFSERKGVARSTYTVSFVQQAPPWEKTQAKPALNRRRERLLIAAMAAPTHSSKKLLLPSDPEDDSSRHRISRWFSSASLSN
jgi:hypothetical protein